MQIQLFATPASTMDTTIKEGGRIRKAIRQPAERHVLGHFTFETWVSYPARTVNADDGLRVEFTVPVHSVLYDMVRAVSAEKTEIGCKYRVRRGFAWGQLGRKASVRIDADLCQGPRGGLYLHCQQVDILEGQPRGGAKLSKSLIKKLEKKAELAAAAAQTPSQGRLPLL